MLAHGASGGGWLRKNQAGFSFLAKGENERGCLWTAWAEMKPGGLISRTWLSPSLAP